MNTPDVMQMEAGRELDALVRERVFGPWDASRCGVCGWPLSSDSTGCIVGFCSMRPVPARRADEPPPFSTVFFAAVLLVDLLRLSVVYSEDGVYALAPDDIVHGCVRGTDAPSLTLVGREHEHLAASETAPLAICRAALLACAAAPAEEGSSR